MSETHTCYNISSVYVHACVVHAFCMRASVWICSGHNSTFVHGFQSTLAKLFSQMRSSAIRNICSGNLEVKVTLEGQMINSCYKFSLVYVRECIVRASVRLCPGHTLYICAWISK